MLNVEKLGQSVRACSGISALERGLIERVYNHLNSQVTSKNYANSIQSLRFSQREHMMGVM
jgi:hypothetical protein